MAADFSYMECDLSGGKGISAELVQKVERYQLDIVADILRIVLALETKLLDRGWTLSFSQVSQGERCQAGLGILTESPTGATVLSFADRRAGHLTFVMWWALPVFCV